MGNTAKYMSYKAAWEKIKAAQAEGFNLETVTICESLISDRLFSYVLGVNPKSKLNECSQFGTLISEWRSLANGPLPIFEGQDLGAAVDAWRKERNTVIHAIAKSIPGTPTILISDYESKAKRCAETGAKLARKVSDWHRQQLSIAQKQRTP